ncbi:GNAT family N-acetyltransferase [Salinithrix halophila]|uniref:GNAT family N-acetyltransferase n=1 Tax=Salinithrix halophila TaxID=1485204 RepID=A0ABV8JFG6_9BACL
MHLRSFQLSDVHAVTSIWKMTASREKEEETLQVLSRQLVCDRDLVLVAEDEGRVVGAIMGTIDKDTGFLYCLAVHPAYQGKGVARGLTQLLENRLRDKGVNRTQAVIDEGTEKLYPFYTHLGYQGIRSSVLGENWIFNLKNLIGQVAR